MREQIPFRISKTDLMLQDESIDLDSITEIEDDTLFTIDPIPKRSFEKEEHVQTDITIEMNLN